MPDFEQVFCGSGRELDLLKRWKVAEKHHDDHRIMNLVQIVQWCWHRCGAGDGSAS